MLLSEGQMSDYKGAALMIDALPRAKAMLGDRGYDADWFRAALAERGITACIPSKTNRKVPIPHDTVLYRQRHRIENMFGKLKDWRRIHTRYDRCAHTFMSAICIAATVIFWLNNEMGWLPPSHTASQCAKKVALRATERKGRQP
jgi:transposase